MATKVDPFVFPIPKELLKDKSTREFFEYLVRWAHDMWVRSGAGDDAISSGDIAETYPWNFADAPESNVQSLFTGQAIEAASNVQNLFQNNFDTSLGKLNAITVNTAYTAQANDFINAKSGTTITLPKYPDDSEIVVIRNGDGSAIKLLGNGKSLNGSTTGTLNTQGTSIEFYYFIDSDEWFAR